MADDKVYDGATTAAAHLSSTEVAAGDEVTFDYASAAFITASAGNAKTVSVTGITLSGADAGKYTLVNTTASATADITPKALTVTGATAADKVYDGKTDATVDFTGASLAGVVGDDDVELDASSAEGSFADEDVDTDIPVSVTGLALSGADAGNYSVTPPALRADITPRTLHVTALGVDKTYDGTTSASVTFGSDKLADDVVTVQHADAAFGSAGVGTDKAIAVTGLGLTGTDAANYRLASTEVAATADIAPAPLTVAAKNIRKLFGNTLAFAGTEFTATGLKGGDAVTSVALRSAGSVKTAPSVRTRSPRAMRWARASATTRSRTWAASSQSGGTGSAPLPSRCVRPTQGSSSVALPSRSPSSSAGTTAR